MSVLLTAWKPTDVNNWQLDPKAVNENLEFMMNDFISNRQYLKIMPNGMMLTQEENTAKFLDSETGEVVCFGYFHEGVITITQ